MIASFIRGLSKIIYKHPLVPQNQRGQGQFGSLKIALVADYFTSISLSRECRIKFIRPDNYREVILGWRPDLIFVESAFHGIQDEWRYKLEKQPRYMCLKASHEIARIVQIARDNNIPAIFWNKDDKAFFEAFLDVARNFKFVFTSDADCVPRYAEALPSESVINVLAMAYQPAFHNFTGFAFTAHEACFVGSYYRKILEKRRSFLDMMFTACEKTNVPLNVFDRNSRRFSHFIEFRFPADKNYRLHQGVEYPATAALYKNYGISLNVNSITDSPTMYSRRLLEILACGGICVTNGNPAVRAEFAEYCHIVSNMEEAMDILMRLGDGPKNADLERAAAGAAWVSSRHTWEKRLEQLAEIVNF